MSDVAVIASTSFGACGGFPEYRCSTEKEYRAVTHTDKDGNFYIPNQLGMLNAEHYIPTLLLLWSTENDFLLTAFKPGYILSRDADTRPNSYPNSVARSASGLWMIFQFKVFDLEMEPVQLSGTVLENYYTEIAQLGLGGYISDDMTPDVRDYIRIPGQEFFANRVCGMAPDSLLSSNDVNSVAMFFDQNQRHDVKNHRMIPSTFRQKLFALDPAGFHSGPFISGGLEYVQGYSKFSAAHVCEAMNEIRNAN
jgi:hypothetical protein